MSNRGYNSWGLLFILSLLLTSSQAQSVKVFIMAGQSNMQGQGDIEPITTTGTLAHFMANDPTADEFSYIQDNDGVWTQREDVWYRHKQEDGSVIVENLTAGLGASSNQIGPELTFGNLIAEDEESRVLIIKTAWGGKSLAVDFRPPSSGGTTGVYYTQMLTDINEAIQNIEGDFPNFIGGNVEISGFCWFQGWNDGDELADAQAYEQNLNNLITDLRTDLQVPDLPFVVALTGHGGYEVEPEGTWLGNLQRYVLPGQVGAIDGGGHDNVAYVDTRDFWRQGNVSPEPDFGFHWHNNAESFLRIGAGLATEMLNLTVGEVEEEEDEEPQDRSFCSCGLCGVSHDNQHTNTHQSVDCMGSIRPNTNMALPASYNYQEYVFPEPDDQGTCLGIQNASASIEQVYIAQTHRHPIGHPLQFTIGERPALFQMAVTGTGAAPDVQVEGLMNGTSLGTLCLDGPSVLSETINLATANFDEYFSVTLPKAWVKIGLELRFTAGTAARTLTQVDLKIRPYTELNLGLVDMDFMDYNQEAHRTPVFENFLQEVASAIPASVVRFGKFPATLRLPDFAFNNGDNTTVVVSTDALIGEVGVNTGNINFFANDVVDRMRTSMGDSPNTIYFGNTLNLDPGGWGGDGAFVSFEYRDVFLHELGHALSLPHWVEDYRRTNPNPDQYSYPFAGEEQEASGRGDTWNFIQATYEFVSPTCSDESGVIGTERSDAMQRGFYCDETRTNGSGPWDGFGAFSAMAMSNYLLGTAPYWGQIEDRGELLDFHFRENDGYPIASLVKGERVFTRHPSQPQNTNKENDFRLPGQEQIEQDAYLIYGSAHPDVGAANIIYEPIKYKGTILPVIDPTDPEMFNTLQNMNPEDAPEFYGRSRDITLKLTYIDGTIKHVLVPLQSFDRQNDFPDENAKPAYFAVSVPADDLLCNVELYHRDFIILDNPDDEELGNINDPLQNITAENFMEEAVLMASLDHSCNCPGTPNYIEPGTPCDDSNPFTVNDVEDGFCNCTGSPIQSCGQIRNSTFDESTVTWRNWESEILSVGGELSVSSIITEFEDAGMAYDNVTLTNGDNYTLKFEAYAEQERSITLIMNGIGDVPSLVQTIDLTTTKQEYVIPFLFSDPSTVEAALEFGFGNDETTFFLDNVCLAICGASETGSDDCNFDSGEDMTTNVDVLLEEDAISLYPNPTTGIFEIAGLDDNYIIRIIRTDGTVVQTINYEGPSHNIDISFLPSGLLFIDIRNQLNESVCIRLIIKE